MQDDINKRVTFNSKKAALFGNIIYYACKIVGWLPWWFLYYFLAEIIYFLLYYIVRYRVNVTRDNLAKAFIEMEGRELRRVESRFYRHLSQVFIETIELAALSPAKLQRRLVVEDEKAHRERTSGQNWTAALSHYGSWEFFTAYAIEKEPNREILGVYKPLQNKAFDYFYKKLRSRTGMIPVPMKSIFRKVVGNREKSIFSAIGLIADQSPPRREEVWHWFDFMGRPTAFFLGMEKMALKFGMPVYFVGMKKVRRGHYRASFDMIWDGREDIEQYELTQRYATRLEAMIRLRPELWMWSHRRWKRQP